MSAFIVGFYMCLCTCMLPEHAQYMHVAFMANLIHCMHVSLYMLGRCMKHVPIDYCISETGLDLGHQSAT